MVDEHILEVNKITGNELPLETGCQECVIKDSALDNLAQKLTAAEAEIETGKQTVLEIIRTAAREEGTRRDKEETIIVGLKRLAVDVERLVRSRDGWRDDCKREANNNADKIKRIEELESLPYEPLACPCLYTEPCQSGCSCVNPSSALGCLRCCTHESEEQRSKKAELLAKRLWVKK